MFALGVEGRLRVRATSRLRLAALVSGGLLAVSILVLAPSLASAAIRYTTPTGSGTACSQASPCSFVEGVTGAGVADGDTIQLVADEYDLTGQDVEVQEDNLTIQGPGPRGTSSTFIPYLMFGAESAPELNRLTFFGSNPKLRNLAVIGEGVPALVGTGYGNPQVTMDRVLISNSSNASGANAFEGDGATITNSIIRYDGGSSTGSALEATGSITGSLAFSANGQAISVDGAFHDVGYCSLTIRNTFGWGGSSNLILQGAAACPSVDVDLDYSWVPNVAGALTGGGWAIPGSGSLALGTNNLPNTPAVFDPLGDYIGNYELPATSPAVNAGCTAGCGTTDYYGRPRPIGSANDIGPYEVTLPPTISDVTVDSKTFNLAELSATINPNGGATTWNFQIRKAGATDWESVQGATTGDGTTPETVSTTAQPLDANTSYEARVVGLNSTGIEVASPTVTTFTTDPAPPTVSIGIRSAKATVSRKKVTVRAKVRTSVPGRVTIRATSGPGGKKTWCKVTKRVRAAGVHTLDCNLGRKGRAKIRKTPLKLMLRAGLTTDSGLAATGVRKLTIRRKR